MTWLTNRAAVQFRSLTGGVLAGAALVALAACSDTSTPTPALDPPKVMYGAVVDDGFKVPAIDIKRIDPRYLRQVVDTPYSIPGQPNTIVVDPANRFLYLVLAGGKSMRYGIGVGREGFAWAGEATIHDKQHWPKWFPPKEMVERDPRLKPVADGQDGGPRNPLGARALYLWQGNKDTLYRLHGTTEPSSIGTAASSGCVRLFNQDIIDLYERVAVGTKVIVLGGPAEKNSLITEIFGKPTATPTPKI
jgi:lipoprotein-anchoring transpeptidase ErfK/SrfK